MPFGDGLAVVGGFGLAKGSLKGLQFVIALQYVIQCGGVEGGRFLGNGGDAPVFRDTDVACVLADFAFDEGKQAGFAAAVAPDKPDTAGRRNLDGGLVKQDFAAALEGEVFDFYHDGNSLEQGSLKTGNRLFRLPDVMADGYRRILCLFARRSCRRTRRQKTRCRW